MHDAEGARVCEGRLRWRGLVPASSRGPPRLDAYVQLQNVPASGNADLSLKDGNEEGQGVGGVEEEEGMQGRACRQT